MVSKLGTIELAALQVFVEVARSGGVTSAADALGIAKSTASKQLSQLEASLKVRLFERSSRRVKLTKEGEVLLARAQSILAEVDRMAQDAVQEASQPAGIVRIAASPEFGRLLVEKFLPPLLAQYPQLQVLMRLEYQFDDLQDPLNDLAFRLGSIADDRLVGQRLGEIERVLVCSPAFQAANPLAKPEDLMGMSALVFTDREISTEWVLESRDSPYATTKIAMRGRFGVRSFNALLAAAEAGLGLTCVPWFVAAPALAHGTLVQPLPQWKAQSAPVYVAYRTGVMRIGRVRAVIDTAIRQIPALLVEHGISPGIDASSEER